MKETGKDIEASVLGGRSEAYAEIENRMLRQEAFDMVKQPEFQPFADATLPKEKPFPRDLQLEVANQLEVYLRQLSYYTAIDSPLDQLGIDAFFELEAGDGRYLRVTLDITTYTGDAPNPERADVIILWPHEGIDRTSEEGGKVWEAKVREVAQAVVARFKALAEKHGHGISNLKTMEGIQKSKQSRKEYKEAEHLHLSRKQGGRRVPRPRQNKLK